MNEKTALVVTSISGPNEVLTTLADGCKQHGNHFIVIGDKASPADFVLDGCDFYGLDRQIELDLKFAKLCPTKHYARKNIGYLVAISSGATMIVETDDDNIPYEQFWADRTLSQSVPVSSEAGWVNVYKYFTDANIWPRGLALNAIMDPVKDYESLAVEEVECPIQQGLADENPDVDAIYRLVLPIPQSFRKDRRLALRAGATCPFNSQNTTWWPMAFGLLYLPSYCSFRMTDIWRSFVAQRIAHANGWGVLFHEPTVRQERNEHDLMRDFKDEIPGYLNNQQICEELSKLDLPAGEQNIYTNLRSCYEKLIEMSLVDEKELALIDAWTEDMKRISV